ncbi:hypothetical protein AMTR_s04785p00004800 [Amborella trichopoda]|uniref:Uncharacterized protein n=1 Tax=Amborella trichopoda TaxID=13333 RepID=U5CLN8_AMBTC|nr:hypothetical protein AMTR_s04785p00004800 [Amborella trichopoda]
MCRPSEQGNSMNVCDVCFSMSERLNGMGKGRPLFSRLLRVAVVAQNELLSELLPNIRKEFASSRPLILYTIENIRPLAPGPPPRHFFDKPRGTEALAEAPSPAYSPGRTGKPSLAS